MLHHTGKSERTIRRQKKALRDLQAQGFQMLPDFFRKKNKEVEKAKFEAFVATAKHQLSASQGREEEEEESSGIETKTAKHDSKVVSEPDMSRGSAPMNTAQPQFPNSAAM